MQTQKKPVGKISLGILCALSNGSTLLPYLIISGLITGRTGHVDFFVPVVIVYTVQRACLVALRGFGGIENPYRIIRTGLIIALPGAALMILSPLCETLLSVGALLTGIGFSPVGAMFAPLYSEWTSRDPALKKSKLIGLLIYLPALLLVSVLSGLRFPVIPILFFLFIAAALIILIRSDADALFGGRKAFDPAKRDLFFFVFGFLTLLCLLVLRQYKQSGVSYMVWIAPVIILLNLIFELVRRRNYRDFVYQTYWSGALKIHLMLFSLLYHVSVGNTGMVMPVYAALSVGGILAGIVGKPLKKLLPDPLCSRVCMILSAGCSFLLTVPSAAVNLIGILLADTFAGIVSADAGTVYLQDERHEPKERPLTRLRINTMGGILGQTVLFSVIWAIGSFRLQRNLLEAYASRTPDPGVGPALQAAGLICSAVLLLSAVLIAVFAKHPEDSTPPAGPDKADGDAEPQESTLPA